MGLETVSVAVAVPGIGGAQLGALARTDGGAAGALAGLRRRWVRGGAEGPGGFVALGVAGSVLALPVGGGAGVGLAPWAAAGVRGRRGGFGLTLAAPLTAGTGEGAGVRLPVTAGLEVAAHAARGVTLGLIATAGAAAVPGLDVAATGDLALVIARDRAAYRSRAGDAPAP